MKKLEKLGLKPAADLQKDRLSRWMYEWSLLQVAEEYDGDRESRVPNDLVSLEQMIPENKNISDKSYIPMTQGHLGIKTTPGMTLEEHVAPTDSIVEVGQIRLMAPVAAEGMFFIVVVSVAPDGVVCCMPFSPFSEPATPDELLSGQSSEVVRVYCLWNMRTVSRSIVNKSWVVEMLNVTEIERLLRGVDAYKCNGVLPDDMQQDAGPVLVHPEDPRREYRSWERQRIDLVLSSNSIVRESSLSYDIESEPLEFLKAAEPGEDYEA